jgi:hypothetical protein
LAKSKGGGGARWTGKQRGWYLHKSGKYISLGKPLDYLEDKEEITRKIYDGKY